MRRNSIGLVQEIRKIISELSIKFQSTGSCGMLISVERSFAIIQLA